MPVHLIIEDSKWHDLLGDIDALDVFASKICSSALEHVSALEALKEERQALSLTAVFVDDTRIQALNREFREQDKPTNVLSFPTHASMQMLLEAKPINAAQADDIYYLGDIILASETIAKEAKEQSKEIEDHVAHLLVHGVLHLLGFDHEEDVQAQEMEALEVEILRTLSIANPYEKSVY